MRFKYIIIISCETNGEVAWSLVSIILYLRLSSYAEALRHTVEFVAKSLARNLDTINAIRIVTYEKPLPHDVPFSDV